MPPQPPQKAPTALDAQGRPVYAPEPAPPSQFSAPVAAAPAQNVVGSLASSAWAFAQRNQAAILMTLIGFWAGTAYEARKRRKAEKRNPKPKPEE